VKLRGIIVSVATAGLMVGPAFANGVFSSVAGARAECTITGTAANDTLFGTTRDDVICAKAGQDNVSGNEGNDVIRGGQGDDGDGIPPCMETRSRAPKGGCRGTRTVINGPTPFGLNGDDGSDVVKGQADDDSIEGQDQNDKLYGGQGADCLGAGCTSGVVMGYSENGNDFLKSRDHVSGNDYVDGGNNTDTCRIDAGDDVYSCEL
jgi:Ca2+-binding RTX toxin-like protein